MRIKEVEKNHFFNTYVRNKGKDPGDEALPDYLRPFVEPLPMNDVKKLAKQILDNTYDNQKEDDYLNTMIYRHLPRHDFLCSCMCAGLKLLQTNGCVLILPITVA